MNIKRCFKNVPKTKVKKIRKLNGGVGMATISFERDIKLSQKAINNIVKISNEPIKNIKRNTNAIESLNKGEEILNRLFSR